MIQYPLLKNVSRGGVFVILAVDMGNSVTTVGMFSEEGKLRFRSELPTVKGGTQDQYAIQLLDVFRLHRCSAEDVTGAIICSVVPLYIDIYSALLRDLFHIEPLILGKKLKTGIRIDVPVPSEVGNDLVADCAGAYSTYGGDCIIADLGTATKIIAFSRGKGFIGVSIMPGVGLGMNALSSGTAALPKVAYQIPASPLGRDTVSAIQSGLLFGTAAGIKEIGSEIGKNLISPSFVLTGGYAEFVRELLPSYLYDRDLLLRGLESIYSRNRHE